MRRCNNNGESSLELLLDTICNMFGGIVLIAILLAVLSKEMGKPEKQNQNVSEPVTAQQQYRLIILSNEYIRVLGDVKKYSNIVGANKTQYSEELKTTLIKEINRQKHKNERFESKNQELQNDNEVLKEKLKNASTEINESKKKDKLQVRVPSAREVSKEPILVIIKNGKYYSLIKMRPGDTPDNRPHDESMFKLSQLPDTFVIQLSENAQGERIEDNIPTRGHIHDMLQNINSDSEYLMFLVYTDSFEDFNKLKRNLIKKSISYNWIPLEMSQEFIPIGYREQGPSQGVVQ